MRSTATLSSTGTRGRCRRIQVLFALLSTSCQSRTDPAPAPAPADVTADAPRNPAVPGGDVRSTPSSRVAGTVRRFDDSPAGEAIVAIVPDIGRRATAVVVADHHGRFQIEVPAGKYAVTATAAGAAAAYREPAAVAPGGQLSRPAPRSSCARVRAERCDSRR